jgi:hypothetical protein
MTQVVYKVHSSLSYDPQQYRQDPETWILDNLQKPGIEQRLEKLIKLVAIIGAKWIEENPDKIADVANAIDCHGFEHEVAKEHER